MRPRLHARSHASLAQLVRYLYFRGFRLLASFILLAFFLLLPLGLSPQDRPPAASPDRFTTKKTWIPTDPRAINDDGVILGPDFVIYKDRSMQLLGPFAYGAGSLLVALNNRGQVLLVQPYGGSVHYFLYDPGRSGLIPVGQNATVAEGSALRPVHFVYLTGLDDAGRVYGVYGTPRGPCAAVGAPTLGTPGDLGLPPAALASFTLIGCPGGGDLRIRAVNSKGQITGGVNQQGFLWTAGKLSTFRFPGAHSTEGYAVNDSGVVAGVFIPGNRIRNNAEVDDHFTPGLGQPQMGFIYDGAQFRLLSFPNDPPIYLTGINNRGLVVGHYIFRDDDNRGFRLDSNKLPIAHFRSDPGGSN